MARPFRACWSATFVKQAKPATDPKALYALSYGLFVLTTRESEKDNGCIINSCFQVAEAPDRLAVSVQVDNLTREMIQRTGVFNVSVLTEDVPFETIRYYGMQSGRDTNKFTGLYGAKRSKNGVYYLTENTCAMFSCKVVETVELGSHVMFIGEVTQSEVLSKNTPCTYAHYHKAIKPKF